MSEFAKFAMQHIATNVRTGVTCQPQECGADTVPGQQMKDERLSRIATMLVRSVTSQSCYRNHSYTSFIT